MPTLSATLLTFLAQPGAPPLDRAWAWSQAWPFLIVGLVILAALVWVATGGLRRERRRS